MSTLTQMIERRRRLLGPAYRLFYDEPVHFVRGDGVWLYDVDGKRYLDAYNNVASVGHCHPRVVEAISRQASTLNTHTRYLHETVLDYTERVLATFPGEPGHAMWTCTGSEANDLAYRIACNYTGGTGLIVTNFAYHGVTVAISQASPSLGQYVQRGPHVRTVRAPDTYRDAPGDIGAALAAAVRDAAADMRAAGIRPAALLVDTVLSSDGVYTHPAGFLKLAVAAIREEGGIFIADEVQAGLGRTGDAMWGFMRHGVSPDIVSMGKPMGNGHPLAGIVAKPELLERFGRESRYFNTFGGNPVSAAAGLAVLDVVRDEQLLDNAQRVGAYLRSKLLELKDRHEVIGDVRGAGFFIGVELVLDRAGKSPATHEASRVVNALRDRQVLCSTTGERANILKIRPPLVFGLEHADLFVDTLDDVLHTLMT
ncbi:MAG TPA: aspartate aminotransferase family protein [Caballeronia sp.]|jgi:4-aminobutyrate aminotransferase-like enzyme|nr:aspartate aminotransferase family protein [Caballeronia sp.]